MVEVEVTFDYIAEQPDELTIKVGDVIKNVIQSEGGWWEGELKGKKGMFPDNFVKVLKDVKKEDEVKLREPKKDVQATKRQSVKDLANKIKDKVHDGPVPVRKKVKKRAKVVFAYEPENEDELRLSVGDMVDILKQEEEGWWEGIVNGNKQGMLPSNFVEIIDESEPSLPEVSEKNETGEGDSNLIKGKKIQGIGLGNIFGDGPIKLRSTAGKKPIDKPAEPTKVERTPQEPFERRPKDARLNINMSANPSVVVGPNKTLLHTQPLTEHQIDVLYRDSTDITNHDVLHEEIRNDLTDLDFEDVRVIEEMCDEIDERSELNTDTSYQNVKNQKVLVAVDSGSLQEALDNSLAQGSRKSFDTNQSASVSCKYSFNGKYSDKLNTILNDLDTCLEMTSELNKSDKKKIVLNTRDNAESSSHKFETSVLCNMHDKDDGEHIIISTSEVSNSAYTHNKSTPRATHNFKALVDSVFVTKKRLSSGTGSQDENDLPNVLPSQSTPVSGKHYNPYFSSSESTSRNLHKPVLPSLRDPPRTDFATLNRSGTTSPYIQSIAHKYHIFNKQMFSYTSDKLTDGCEEAPHGHDSKDDKGLEQDETVPTSEMDGMNPSTDEETLNKHKQETKPVEKAVVRYSYKAENEDELSLNEGDIITVLNKELEDSGWWKGELNGHVGVFPDNFVELMEEEVKPKVPEKAPRPVVTTSTQPKPKRPQQPPAPIASTKPAPKLPDKAPVVEQHKPEPVKDEKPVVIAAKKPPPLTKKPVKPADTHEDKTKHDHVNTVNAAGSFESVEPASEKLTHLTANRARGPAKRPPSQVFIQNDEEKNGEIKDSHKEERTAHFPPTLAERKEEVVTKLPSHSVPVRPAEPPAANPGILSAIEELKREISDLKSNTVSKSAYNELRAENEKLRQDLDSLKATYSRRLKDIMAEVDEEKKIRLSTQVEMERIRKLVAESHV